MKINLIQSTIDPLEILYTACRTCYSDKDSFEIYENSFEPQPSEDDDIEYIKKKQKLVQKVLDSGHYSTAEHLYFSFTIDGVSRALSHQLVRHRIASYSQKSQRYVKQSGFDYITPETILGKESNCETPYGESMYPLIDRYKWLMGTIAEVYEELIEAGVPAEDARYVLPNACTTSLVMSINLRSLMNLCNLRLCFHAQKEFRDMVELMKKEILKNDNYKFLSKYLVPNCKNCTDFRGCKNKEIN